jgi:hypothetical protein
MKYGDFSSLVQLEVGLHVGTALLQLYGEIGIQPFVRALHRIQELVDTGDAAALKEQLEDLSSDLAIFRIELFNEFKKYVKVNFCTALILIAILIIISYKAEDDIPDSLTVLFSSISILPAFATLGALWFDASKRLRPLKTRAEALEDKALKHG